MDHPVIQELLDTGRFVELKPYDPIEQGPKFTAGVLMTIEGGIRPTPTVLMSTEADIEATGSAELYSLYHLGHRLTGHSGIVHGGLLATLLDEALCRCGFCMLPHKVGVTASLNVDYRRPTHCDNWMLLHAKTTEVNGRKVWVSGATYVLPPGTEHVVGDLDKLEPTMEAKLLVVEPKWYERLLDGPATRLHEQKQVAELEQFPDQQPSA